jgi:hypothetical protein
VYDPSGTHSLVTIGYLGGVDRGIAVGHIPDNTNLGVVTGISGQAVTPVNPANFGSLSGGIFKAFAGHELQYLELGAQAASAIHVAPVETLFWVDIQLAGVQAGDSFRFALADIIAIMSRGAHGVFTTSPGLHWDTGGDSVSDGTPTTLGPDADAPVPVPPAAFAVDFVDGVTGPATIIVGTPCYANCDRSSSPPILNVNDFICFQSRFAAGDSYANCDASSIPPVLNVSDFVCFLNAFAAGCP